MKDPRVPGIVPEKDGKRQKRELYGHPCPIRGNLHHLLTPGYDREASRVRMAARTQRGEKGNLVTKLEEVLPLLRERFGVTKIGIFGSTAPGEDRTESDVDVLVEISPDHLTFRNVSALADFLEELYGQEVDLVTVGGRDPLIRQDVKGEVAGVKRDLIVLRRVPTNSLKGRTPLALLIPERPGMITAPCTG